METHAHLGRATNAFTTSKEFKQAGDDVVMVFDGAGVETVAALADPEHQMHKLYLQVEDRVAGACRYCARAFDVYEKLEELGVPFLSDFEQHPSLRKFVNEGRQIITF